jgi:2-acylglycerol O-acyltransferase 2
MATAASAPEPSVPEEREKQHLPPKSYADAVEEEAPIDQETHENEVSNGSQGEDGGNANGYNPPRSATRQKASVLRIVASDTQGEYKSGENKSEREKSEEKLSRPDLSRGVSKEEYTATVCLSFS